MPNAGKSSLFNALTRAGAEAANYPFTTIEPNVAVVPVRDARLDQVAATIGASNIVYDTSTSTTSPASCGARTRARASATSSWPTSARRTRSSTSSAPTTTRTSSTPRARSIRSRDIETIETELIYADLEQAERRHERVVRDARGPATAPRSPRRRGSARSSTRCSRAGRRAPCPARRTRRRPCANLVAADRQAGPVRRERRRGRRRGPGRGRRARRGGGRARRRRVQRLEAELSELDDEDAAAMRADLGVRRVGPRPRRQRRLRAAGPELAFFTAGEDKPAQSWHLQARPDGVARGGRDPHRHPEGVRPRGDHRLGGARRRRRLRRRARRGTLRLEGRDYVMPDGDVITVQFTP